ncbi:hypothetical protein HHI36_019933 [Cryptolaemus montrouzieri]|uniref:Uncharacterized protein n=1 Tax=Cryptolaemus montrouzieri TaxID=559131 RepID=A0ABD2N914_9CUCU
MFLRGRKLVELAVSQPRDSSSESGIDSKSSEEILSDMNISESDSEDDNQDHVEELEVSEYAAGGSSVNCSINCQLPNIDANWIEIEAFEELSSLTV